MRNILIALCYRGTAYHGFQVQKNAPSVCAAIQDALERVLGHRPDVKGCSRTDAGVHANMFCLSFGTERPIPCEKLPLALNFHLPADIAVYHAREVPLGFHPRYDCLGKAYSYRLLESHCRPPFGADLCWQQAGRLDEGRLNAICRRFEGRRDFRAVCSPKTEQEDTVRCLEEFSVRREGPRLIFTARADGFLYNMVRILVGTAVEMERGLLPADVCALLAGRDRQRAGQTAPARGLYLDRVFYDLPGWEAVRSLAPTLW
ncbi:MULTISPECIES: tRNA pseudouridine(38-40) synthase TruA [Eubacteriales]|uniref:tRNA pseudouridine synthase A n=1 Tax=Bittarella massiliensis (ex Durand et al. 2017) TaxID=1720313 RepID=A0AAQ1RWU3_9FIRM|nr:MULTISPECIES: tRNA pseudouridine(38-40) synthase TruA [Eubacteriales]ERI99709.1 tRNA pseudouridine synthase A [Clostridium sp. ATCC 29733]MZL69843.1 tRNA pseudouridine(38-40) synthase TruA [Bittarella massiliensis (ex Durand et al. 2017)]MZL81448.1 tRNA pseudouridine(38-40) synthase TruA [Bittarella massiliensis (ex Durand et al. 2017)]SHG47886.1 tRNA pseudouridine38-40 synthase [Bittarella massiliensis (ex Durand et al. 2017)]